MMGGLERSTTVRQMVTMLLGAALAAGCAGNPSPVTTAAAPPVATRPMPRIPDLSGVRTFTRPIPGVPASNAGVTQPVLQRLGELKYPPRAWDQGLQGWAVYDFVVAADGRVDGRYVRLVRASDSVFVQPAADAVRAARFTPARRGGTAVPMLVRLPVTFAIERDARPGRPGGGQP
jgi:protein TonB